jgi:hypothetical protein
MRKFNYKKIIGAVFVLAGIVLLLNNPVLNITGNAISDSVGKVSGSIFGLVFVIVGVLVMMNGRGEGEGDLVRRINVYDKAKGSKESNLSDDDRYFMEDPTGGINGSGEISLGHAKKSARELSDALELLQEEYGPGLLENRDNKRKFRIARKFLNIFYAGKIPEDTREQEPLVSEDEEIGVRNAFGGGWDTKPNGGQRKILSRFNLGYRQRNNSYGEIYDKDNENLSIKVSCSSSDVNAGKNIGKDVISLIKKSREDKS